MADALVANRSRSRLETFGIVWFLTALFIVFQILELHPSLFWLALEAVTLVAAGVATLSTSFVRGFWSPAVLFLLIVGIFHVGLAPFAIFDWDPLFIRADDYTWFYGEVGRQAFAAVNLFIASFVFAAIIVALVTDKQSPLTEPVPSKFLGTGRTGLAKFGALVLIGGVLYWFYLAYSAGGVGIFFGSYISFLSVTANTNLPVTYMVIGLGLGLAALGHDLRLVQLSLLAFAAYAFIAFFLGLRGEVLFPTAVAASVFAYRVRMPKGGWAVAACAFVLSLINGARNIRERGISGGPVDVTAFSPLEALAEMGSSLRVVSQVIIWHEHQGEDYQMGDTYTVAPVRLLEGLFSPTGTIPAGSDFRLMNSEIMSRSGAIGGSVIAEPFHNFGIVGVVLIAVCLGVLFGYFSQRSFTVAVAVTYVCVAVPLFNHIRNSFVPVLPFILISGLVVGCVYLFVQKTPKSDIPREQVRSVP